ncbi:MAG: type II secretion system protein [Bacilli bacterium]
MNKKTKTKKGFTLVEILVVIVILSILAIGVIAIITNYMDAGKEKYDESLESEFLLAGQSYFANNKDKIPTRETESNVVYLSELMSLNFVNGEFVDSKGNVCSADSSVMITNNGDKGYKYTACLYCGENSVFNKKGECKVYTIDYDPSKNSSTDKCYVMQSNGVYFFTDENGKLHKSKDKTEIIKKYIGTCGRYCEETIIKGYSDTTKYVYSSTGAVYNTLADAQKDGECTKCVQYGIKNPKSSDYKCFYSKDSSYATISGLKAAYNEEGVPSGEDGKNYYYHCLTSDAFNEISEVSTSDTKPDYITNGTAGSTSDYWNAHKQTTKLKNSTNDYVKKDTAIPSEYSFAMGKAASAKVTNPTPMAWADVKSWQEKYYSYTKDGWVTKDSASAKGNYSVYYTNVGTYNGKKIDLKMTLMGFTGCIKNKDATACGLWFGIDRPKIYSLGVYYIRVKYEFFDSNTKESITVKGYTTYWDLDAQQGIHFISGTTGIYVYSQNDQSYIYNINNAPYVYARVTTNDRGENGDDYVVSETFYVEKSKSMIKTFTFLRAEDTSMSSYYRSAGQIENSPIPAGLTLNYYNPTTSNIVNSDTVLKPGQEVTYIARFSNPTKNTSSSDGTRTITLTVDTDLEYVEDVGKSSNITSSSPTKDGKSLKWTAKVKDLDAAYIIFKLKVPENSCGENAKVSAKSKVTGISTYRSPDLINPILCSEKTNYCTTWSS